MFDVIDAINLIDMFIYACLYDFFTIDDDSRNPTINTNTIGDVVQHADAVDSTDYTNYTNSNIQKLAMREFLLHAFI